MKILVVDDELVICNGCRIILEERGHVVETCMTCSDGIAAIQKTRYDLVLLDLKLPDQDGSELLKAAHRNNGNRIIVMSGYATVQSAVNSMKLGAIDYLPKPFTDDELLDVVKKAEDAW
ncbi:MAG: response regulator [Desulfocapsaceae bacterium]|nr:response regulator [Desulfocapsaceae bacterium]